MFRCTFLAQPVDPPSLDAMRGSLSGVTLLASLAPGIVGEQVHALLSGWDVDTLVPANDDVSLSPPPGKDCVAWIVDADANCGALLAAARQRRREWGSPNLPLILIARPSPTEPAMTDSHDCVVSAPVNASRLHEAVSAVVADRHATRPAIEPPLRRALQLCRPMAILLVEDNEANRRVQQLMLEELGCVAEEAGDGLDAVERASRRDYDVILMDVHMPGIDGLEATRRIRSLQPSKRPFIVALTADAGPDEEDRCLAAGMDVYHAKPVRFDTLASVMRTVANSEDS